MHLWFRVAQAAKGAAIFETVSEGAFKGRVSARVLGKGITATSGLLQYTDETGLPATITFGSRDLQVLASIPCDTGTIATTKEYYSIPYNDIILMCVFLSKAGHR